MYDYSRLLGAMREKAISQEQLAQKIHINPATLNAKLQNKSQFKQKEMLDIMQVLDLPGNDIQSYFFARKLAKTQVV